MKSSVKRKSTRSDHELSDRTSKKKKRQAKAAAEMDSALLEEVDSAYESPSTPLVEDPRNGSPVAQLESNCLAAASSRLLGEGVLRKIESGFDVIYNGNNNITKMLQEVLEKLERMERKQDEILYHVQEIWGSRRRG